MFITDPGESSSVGVFHVRSSCSCCRQTLLSRDKEVAQNCESFEIHAEGVSCRYGVVVFITQVMQNSRYRASQLYKNISMLFLFPVKDGKLSTGVNAAFNASCYG